MGREVRRVPANWEHPQKRVFRPFPHMRYETEYQPMHNRSVEAAWTEWQEGYVRWLAGEHDEVIAKYGTEDYPKNEPYRSYCKWSGGPPDPDYYRPDWKPEEMTWYQAYDTVSEGTPTSPPFATEEELIDYLATNGDFWDQKRRAEGGCSMPCGPWGREAAERFVRARWSPSMAVTQTADGCEIKLPRDG